MTIETTNQGPPDAAGKRWLKEARFAGLFLLGSLIGMPAIIYAVGLKLLGPYGGGDGIGSFYGDFARNLGTGTFRTWFIVIAPYLMAMILRAIFWPWGRKPAQSDSSATLGSNNSEPAQLPSEGKRREPFIAP